MGIGAVRQNLSEVDVGWLAGLIDGEGSVTLDRHGTWRRPGVSAASTDLEILEKTKRLAGGSISKAKTERTDPRYEGRPRKRRWNWKISGARQALAILRQVLPHMACPKKIARARYVLEHYERLTPLNGLVYSEDQKKAKRLFESAFFALER
jgi:hypothetical protein